jgi:hypothetical protein
MCAVQLVHPFVNLPQVFEFQLTLVPEDLGGVLE